MKRKAVKTGVLLFALVGILCQGCKVIKTDTAVKRSEQTSEKTKPEEVRSSRQKKKQKKETSAVTTQQPKDVLKEDYTAFPQKYNSWWFKRNPDHMPAGAQEDIDIDRYHACYLNKQAMKQSKVDKVFYLTFDCGYDNGYTEKMLDILKKHKAKAAFFVTQTYIRDSLPIVKRMKKEGHIVGNHTITHPNLSNAPVEKIKEELTGCQQYMKEASGYDMDPYFRPPKGEYSEYLLQVAKDLGYTTVFWSMAYLDYDVNKQPPVEHVVEHWQKYYHPGCIALIHNVSSANAGALDTVLTNLEKEGYRFGTLDEIKFSSN